MEIFWTICCLLQLVCSHRSYARVTQVQTHDDFVKPMLRQTQTQRPDEEILRTRGRVDDSHARSYGRIGPAGNDNLKNSGSVFRGVWQAPNSCQEDFGIEIPLGGFGIEFNADHSWRYGDVICVIKQMTGLWPYVNPETKQFVNGGLPQLGNLTAHLESLTADMPTFVPDPNFNGIGMIDWEQWHPQWHEIQGFYHDFSTALVQSRHPDWDEATVSLVAELEWTQASKLFMESTLKLLKLLRPKARWGYYHYPYCSTIKTYECRADQMVSNDRIMWLFNESTVLYPSIYLKQKMNSSAAIRSRLSEAFRMREKSSDPKGPIYSYTRFNYSDTDFYYTLEDLNNTILTSAEFGTNGVVFWGDKNDTRTAQSCGELRDYVRNALGPAFQMVRKGATACSGRVCSGHGRCVGRVLTCERATWGNEDERPKRRPAEKSNVCSCRCFAGWTGSDCSKATRY